MSVFGDETHHLMICGRDNFHDVQPGVLQDGIEGDKSSTIENCTLRVIGFAWIDNIMSPREVVEAQLNPNNIRSKFSKLKGMNPICFITDICKRFAELPGSTKIRLTLKSLIPSVRIKASRCGSNIQMGPTRGNRITPSIG